MKLASVNRKNESALTARGPPAIQGCTAALISIMRPLISAVTAVTSRSAESVQGSVQSSSATICEAPAKTKAEKATASHKLKPFWAAAAPKAEA
jgi:hypothetical protein